MAGWGSSFPILTLADLGAPCRWDQKIRVGQWQFRPTEQIKHKRTGALPALIALCVLLWSSVTLCLLLENCALECDVFGHLQRLQFYILEADDTFCY